MIYHLPFWNKKSTYFIQTNNSVESLLKARQKHSWTETCGPTAAVSIVAALGQPVRCYTVGGWEPQPEDVLALYMNDPSNKKKFLKARDNLEPGIVPGNRVPQYFPVALKDVFGIDASFEWGCSYEQIVKALKAEIGILICLKDPGHYVAVVAVDTAAEEIIYNDPWPQNYWPVQLSGTSGFNRRMSRAEFESNTKPFRVEIGG